MLTVCLQQSVDEPSNPAVHFISNTQRCRSVCCFGNCTWPAWRWHYVLAETAGHYQRTDKELSENRQSNFRELPGYYQRTVRVPSENCRGTIWELWE